MVDGPGSYMRTTDTHQEEFPTPNAVGVRLRNHDVDEKKKIHNWRIVAFVSYHTEKYCKYTCSSHFVKEVFITLYDKPCTLERAVFF